MGGGWVRGREKREGILHADCFDVTGILYTVFQTVFVCLYECHICIKKIPVINFIKEF